MPFSTWWISHLGTKPFHFSLTMGKVLIVVKASLSGKPICSCEVQSWHQPTIWWWISKGHSDSKKPPHCVLHFLQLSAASDYFQIQIYGMYRDQWEGKQTPEKSPRHSTQTEARRKSPLICMEKPLIWLLLLIKIRKKNISYSVVLFNREYFLLLLTLSLPLPCQTCSWIQTSTFSMHI